MGELILAAAPLGNVGDASTRLREEIERSEFVAAEDSRRFARLCKDLGIDFKGKVISFFEGNEVQRLAELEQALMTHDRVLLITDAGMPTVSDPGYRAVRMAIDSGFNVRVLPGPSAVTTALALSGLSSDRFCFEGFAPRSEIARNRYFEELKEQERTMIFFEAPHRVCEFLKSAALVFGEKRPASISREMTKTHEETVRGSLEELRLWSESKEMLGEFTIVIEGLDRDSLEYSDADLAQRLKDLEGTGLSKRDAIAKLAKELHISKRRVFDIAHQ